ncbi:MAG: sigma-70 family RNA polymerase sigma factor [Verrucomicrobiae bacterium]|nr:sigma-70 family RNA polymerase sigma factor [Verrucomicrobiae bacterium]
MTENIANETWEQLYERALDLVAIPDPEARLNLAKPEYLGWLYLRYANLMDSSYFMGVSARTWTENPGLKHDLAFDASYRRYERLEWVESLSTSSFVYLPKEKSRNPPSKTNIITNGNDMKDRGYGDCENRIKSFLRRRRKDLSYEATLPNEDFTVSGSNHPSIKLHQGSPAGSGDAIDFLKRALEKIDPKYAEAIRLKYFEGKSQAEIAQIMEVSTATISDWIGEKGLKIALKALKKAIQEQTA